MIVPPAAKTKASKLDFFHSFLDLTKTDLSYEDTIRVQDDEIESIKLEPMPYTGIGDSIYIGDYAVKTFISDHDYNEAVENSEKFYTDQHELMTGLSDDDRLKVRIEMCRTFHGTGVNWRNGTGNKSTPYYCGCYLKCSFCLQIRADKIKDGILEAQVKFDNKLRHITLSPEQAKELTRAIGKENFERLPNETGKDLVIYYTIDQNLLDLFPGEAADSDFIEHADWLQIARTPKGRKVSGGITKSFSKVASPEKEDAEKKDKILGEQAFIIPDSDKELIAWRQAIAQSKDLDPKTPLELQSAIIKRTNLFVNIFRDLGGIVRCTKLVSLYVKMSQVDWQSPLKELDLSSSP